MSRSFRKGRHPQNLYRAKHGAYCDHLSPIRNTGKVNRHLLHRLAESRAWYCSPIFGNSQWKKRTLPIRDNERQAYCEFMHRHRLWNEPQREQAFKREARRCEEQTARKRDVAERIADWLEDQAEIRAEFACECEQYAHDMFDYNSDFDFLDPWRERVDHHEIEDEGSDYDDTMCGYDLDRICALDDLERY